MDRGADSEQLFHHVVCGFVGGLLHHLREKRRRLRGTMQHDWHGLPIQLCLWLHVSHHCIRLQPGWVQSTGSSTQLHYECVSNTRISKCKTRNTDSFTKLSLIVSLFLYSPMLSSGRVRVASFHRDVGDLVVSCSGS